MLTTRRVLLLLLFLALAVLGEHQQHRVGYLHSNPPSSIAPFMIRHYLTTWRAWATREPASAPITQDNISEYAPNVYRLLTPALYAGLQRTGYPEAAHSLWTILLLFLLYVALYRFAQLWFPPALSLGFVALAVALNLHPWYVEPSGILQGLLLVACLLALARRSWWLYPAFILAMANREDALLIIAVLALWMLFEPRLRRRLPAALVLTAVAAAYELGAHWWLGSRPRYCTVLRHDENLQDLLFVLRTGNLHEPIAVFLALFVVLVMAAFVGWRGKSPLLRSMTLSGLAYVCADWLVALAREPHRNWQAIVLLLPAAYATFAGYAQVTEREDGDEALSV